MTATTAPPRIGVRTALPALTVVPLLRYAIAVRTVPADQRWRTTCPCRNPLWPNAIGPPAVWMRPTGRRSPYTAEAAILLGAARLAFSGLGGFALAAYAWWTATMIVLAFVDAAVMRLPHRITAAAAAGFLSLLALGSPAGAWARAVAAGLVLTVFFAMLAAASRGQLGCGVSPSPCRWPPRSAGTAGPLSTRAYCSALGRPRSPRSHCAASAAWRPEPRYRSARS